MVYTDKNYKSLLLREEKRLIIKALTKTQGSLRQAHKLLCPEPVPWYSYNALTKVVANHQINLKDFR